MDQETQKPAVLGLGGVFLRAKDPATLGQWYAAHLGVAINAAWNGTQLVAKDGDETVFSLFKAESDYFPREQQVMLNWRVSDLVATRNWLIAQGVRVDERHDTSEYGSFGWAWDCEGNKFELWQPPA